MMIHLRSDDQYATECDRRQQRSLDPCVGEYGTFLWRWIEGNDKVWNTGRHAIANKHNLIPYALN